MFKNLWEVLRLFFAVHYRRAFTVSGDCSECAVLQAQDAKPRRERTPADIAATKRGWIKHDSFVQGKLRGPLERTRHLAALWTSNAAGMLKRGAELATGAVGRTSRSL